MEKKKNCGQCGKFLALKNYEKYGGKRGKKSGLQSYRSICRECRKKIKNIKELKVKARLLLDFFNGKCYECNADVTLLPSIEFHHPDPNLKTASWRKIRGKNYNEAIKWIINDQVIPLCGNCHSKKQAKYYNLFINLIEKELFQKTPEEIDNLIDQSIKKHPNRFNVQKYPKIKYQIKRWIRKCFIVEQFTNGTCIVCKKINIPINLPAFKIHHREPRLKDLTWDKLQDLDCEEILRILKKENCVIICSNCHSIFHSNYGLLIKDILKDLLNEKDKRIFEKKVNQLYNSLEKRINEYEIDFENINFKSPLKLEFPQQDVWKKQLLSIYYFSQRANLNVFTVNNLSFFLKKSYNSAYLEVKGLLKRNYLETVDTEDFSQKIFTVSSLGMSKVKEIERINENTAQKIKNKILNIDLPTLDLEKSRSEHDEILILYSLIIFDIIQKRGFNEFVIKDLTERINRKHAHIAKTIKDKLFPHKFVEPIINPRYIKRVTTAKVYKLTEKGFKLANENSNRIQTKKKSPIDPFINKTSKNHNDNENSEKDLAIDDSKK